MKTKNTIENALGKLIVLAVLIWLIVHTLSKFSTTDDLLRAAQATRAQELRQAKR